MQTDTVDGAKSVTGKLAQSDPALLERTDATPVNVVVKLDYDATASYNGDIAGLPATSPRVTGKKLTGTSAAEQDVRDVHRRHGRVSSVPAAAQLPGAKLGQSLHHGLRRRRRAAAGQPGRRAAGPPQRRRGAGRHAEPAARPTRARTFIGAPTIWAPGGRHRRSAGKGVIFADLDTGVWPEHPSFADNPALGNPPPPSNGQPARPATSATTR